MKYQQLKLQLIKESGILLGILAVIGGVTYYLGSVSDDFTSKNQALEGSVSAITGETNTLRDKYSKVQQNTSLYQEVMQKNAKEGLYINRQHIREKFNQFKNRYTLNNLRLSMAPVEQMADLKYKRKTSEIVSSNVTVSFDTLSDEEVYSLLDAMGREMTGAPKITKMIIARPAGGLTEEMLKIIGLRGSYPLVKGELGFTWLGIRPIEDDPSKKKP